MKDAKNQRERKEYDWINQNGSVRFKSTEAYERNRTISIRTEADELIKLFIELQRQNYCFSLPPGGNKRLRTFCYDDHLC